VVGPLPLDPPALPLLLGPPPLLLDPPPWEPPVPDPLWVLDPLLCDPPPADPPLPPLGAPAPDPVPVDGLGLLVEGAARLLIGVPVPADTGLAG
jgi:hypothetical protein